MVGKFEEQYFDQLRALEQGIYGAYQANPDLVDFQVDKVLEGLERGYSAEINLKRSPALRLNPAETKVYDALKAVCDLHLGRDAVVQVGESALSLEEMLACVKRIRRSVSQMNGKGRQAYLEFISQFFENR